MGAYVPLSSTDNLHEKKPPKPKFGKTQINYLPPAKSFGRKSLLR